MNEAPDPLEPGHMHLPTAADLQDNLMTATNDLDRLQTLLADACETLMQRFSGASEQVRSLQEVTSTQGSEVDPNEIFQGVHQNLCGAVIALQFQDMACQLINHTSKRLRNCADTLARETFGQDDEGEGSIVVTPAPLRPNPVTQSEMDAGSVDLF